VAWDPVIWKDERDGRYYGITANGRGGAASNRDANSGCLAIAYDFYPLPVEFAWDLMEVTYLCYPWLTGSYHPR
jgi:hypothetical protein